MEEKINSIARILNIFNEVTPLNEAEQCLSVWSRFFELDSQDQIKNSIHVSNLLSQIHFELEIAREQMKKTSFPENMYDSAFNCIENAISPLLIAQQWTHVKQHLRPEVFTALNFCCHILPDEESEISEEDIQAIQQKLDELRAALDETFVSVRLQALIENQIKLIEKALAEYRIKGAKALRSASHQAMGEIIEAKDEIASDQNSPVIGKLIEVWTKVVTVADTAQKIEKVYKLGNTVWEIISPMLGK